MTCPVRALYAFTPGSEGQGQIALQANEIVVDASPATSEWLHGTNQAGQHGLFPANYVEKLEPLMVVKANFDLSAPGPGYLPLTAGERYVVHKQISDDWYEGCTTGYSQFGLFPVPYVSVIGDAAAAAAVGSSAALLSAAASSTAVAAENTNTTSTSVTDSAANSAATASKAALDSASLDHALSLAIAATSLNPATFDTTVISSTPAVASTTTATATAMPTTSVIDASNSTVPVASTSTTTTAPSITSSSTVNDHRIIDASSTVSTTDTLTAAKSSSSSQTSSTVVTTHVPTTTTPSNSTETTSSTTPASATAPTVAVTPPTPKRPLSGSQIGAAKADRPPPPPLPVSRPPERSMAAAVAAGARPEVPTSSPSPAVSGGSRLSLRRRKTDNASPSVSSSSTSTTTTTTSSGGGASGGAGSSSASSSPTTTLNTGSRVSAIDAQLAARGKSSSVPPPPPPPPEEGGGGRSRKESIAGLVDDSDKSVGTHEQYSDYDSGSSASVSSGSGSDSEHESKPNAANADGAVKVRRRRRRQHSLAKQRSFGALPAEQPSTPVEVRTRRRHRRTNEIEDIDRTGSGTPTSGGGGSGHRRRHRRGTASATDLSMSGAAAASAMLTPTSDAATTSESKVVPPPPPPSVVAAVQSTSSMSTSATKRMEVSAPANFTRNTDIVAALLKQAGIDPAVVQSGKPPPPLPTLTSSSDSQRVSASTNAQPTPVSFTSADNTAGSSGAASGANSALPLAGVTLVAPIVLPPPPLEIKTRVTMAAAFKEGMNRDAYITAKIQELAEREAAIVQREQHQLECQRLLNEQREALMAREQDLLKREVALGARHLPPRSLLAGSPRRDSLPVTSSSSMMSTSSEFDALSPRLSPHGGNKRKSKISTDAIKASVSELLRSPKAASRREENADEFITRIDKPASTSSLSLSTPAAAAAATSQATGAATTSNSTAATPSTTTGTTIAATTTTITANNTTATTAGTIATAATSNTAGTSVASSESRTPRRRRLIATPDVAAAVLQAVWRGRRERQTFKRILYRTRVAHEILYTERTYISNLKTIKFVFMMPVEERFGNKELLTRMEYSILFQNIEYIMLDALEFWKELEKRMKLWSVVCCIGDLFIRLSNNLAAYQQYVNHYAQASDMLKQHQKKKTAFDAHCRAAKSDPSCAGLDLESYLIMPVQRIPRYIMLLRDLHRHTPPSHPDYAALDTACVAMGEFAQKMNERKRDKDALADLAAIAERVRVDEMKERGDFVVLTEGRVIKEKYGVVEVCPSYESTQWPVLSEQRVGELLEAKRAGQARTLIVFNDCLLLCRGAPSDKKLMAELRLESARLHAVCISDAANRAQAIVLIETRADASRYPYCRARHYVLALSKKEMVDERHCADMIQRAILAARGTDAHAAQLILEQRLFGKRPVKTELFRDAVSVRAGAPNAEIRQLVVTALVDSGIALHAATAAAQMPLLLLVESGVVIHEVGPMEGFSTSDMPPPAAAMSSSSTLDRAAFTALLSGAAAFARHVAACGRAGGHESLLGCELFAPRAIGSLTPVDPIRYTAAGDDVVVAVQTKEQLMGILRADADLATRFYRVVCARLNHLLQHVPAPSSAEQLSAATLDANIARRGQTNVGPSLVDPTRARALKDEALRMRFGLRSADHLVKEFPCLLVEHITLAGTMYVFNSHLCIGARFFDADIRRTTTIAGITDIQAVEGGAISFKTHTSERLHCDVGAGQRDVLLGMLRLFAAQAAAQGPLSPHHTPPSTQAVGLWRLAEETAPNPYPPIDDGTADERPLSLSESDWAHLYRSCAHSMFVKKDEIVIRQGGVEAASTARVYGIARGAVSLERRSDEGVTRFATLNADAVFNEMALALPGSGAPTVNAVSLDDTLLYYIDASSLEAGGVDALFEARLLRYLAGRLRDSFERARRVCTHHSCHLVLY